jgi:hypothetical protein
MRSAITWPPAVWEVPARQRGYEQLVIAENQ